MGRQQAPHPRKRPQPARVLDSEAEWLRGAAGDANCDMSENNSLSSAVYAAIADENRQPERMMGERSPGMNVCLIYPDKVIVVGWHEGQPFGFTADTDFVLQDNPATTNVVSE